jgi:SPP1 gp7 family putative phage head morphogenesis protein
MGMTKKVRLPKAIYPKNVEVEYFKEFNRQLQKWIKDIYRDILRVARLDDASDDIDDYMNRALAAWYKISGDMELKVAGYFLETNKINKKSFDRQLNAFSKQRNVNIFTSDPDLSSALKPFLKENALLIKNVGDDVAKKIELTVLNAIQTGQGTKYVIKELQAISGYAKNRAALISVDQIGKANGVISKLRYQKNGLEYYIWSDSNDQKVRPQHQLYDGTKRSWNESPIPGSEIRCRCVAEPSMDELDDIYT